MYNKFEAWNKLEDIKIRNLRQIQSAIAKDEIDLKLQQIQEDLVTITLYLQRLIAPLE